MAGPEDRGKRRDKENHYRCAALLHPLRNRILRLISDGRETGASGLAAELDAPPGQIAYHLRVLAKRRALEVVPRPGRPGPPTYRRGATAGWAQKMLDEIDEQGSEEG
jgi:DNA-binding transcriptional ArsR family regulator